MIANSWVLTGDGNCPLSYRIRESARCAKISHDDEKAMRLGIQNRKRGDRCVCLGDIVAVWRKGKGKGTRGQWNARWTGRGVVCGVQGENVWVSMHGGMLKAAIQHVRHASPEELKADRVVPDESREAADNLKRARIGQVGFGDITQGEFPPGEEREASAEPEEAKTTAAQAPTTAATAPSPTPASPEASSGGASSSSSSSSGSVSSNPVAEALAKKNAAELDRVKKLLQNTRKTHWLEDETTTSLDLGDEEYVVTGIRASSDPKQMVGPGEKEGTHRRTYVVKKKGVVEKGDWQSLENCVLNESVPKGAEKMLTVFGTKKTEKVENQEPSQMDSTNDAEGANKTEVEQETMEPGEPEEKNAEEEQLQEEESEEEEEETSEETTTGKKRDRTDFQPQAKVAGRARIKLGYAGGASAMKRKQADEERVDLLEAFPDTPPPIFPKDDDDMTDYELANMFFIQMLEEKVN